MKSSFMAQETSVRCVGEKIEVRVVCSFHLEFVFEKMQCFSAFIKKNTDRQKFIWD